VIPIHLPPLRDFPEDIPLLATTFVERANARYGKRCQLAVSTLAVLQAYAWPGNVRQLENVAQRLVLTSPSLAILPQHLPENVRRDTSPLVLNAAQAFDQPLPADGIDLPRVLGEIERRVIEQAIALAEGNKSRAAALLHVSRTTLLDKLKRWDG
jgi:DNA-binding NtrC family response regulator